MKILAALFIILGSYIFIMNWASLFISYKQKKHVSSAPFVAALFLSLGMYQFELSRPLFWFPFLLDYGTIVFVLSVPRLVNEIISTSNLMLIEHYEGRASEATYVLKLYKKNIFVIEANFTNQKKIDGQTAFISSFSRCGKWKKVHNAIDLWGYEGEKTLSLNINVNGNLISKETPEDLSSVFSLDNISFEKK